MAAAVFLGDHVLIPWAGSVEVRVEPRLGLVLAEWSQAGNTASLFLYPTDGGADNGVVGTRRKIQRRVCSRVCACSDYPTSLDPREPSFSHSESTKQGSQTPMVL